MIQIKTSVNQLIKLMKKCIGDKNITVEYVQERRGEIKHNYCDISLARVALGYKPQVNLLDGLKKTWDWFVEYPVQNDTNF